MENEANLGVTGTEQPAAPSEEAQIVVDETAAVDSEQPQAEQITESVVASEPVAAEEEQEFIEGSELGDDQTRIPYDKKLGRKYFMQVQQMGGDPVFNAVADLASAVVSSEPDGGAIADKLLALNPEAYQRAGWEIVKATIAQKFGQNVTLEQIEQALQRPAEQPEPPPADDLDADYVSPAVQAQLDELKELKAKFPQLETEVGQFKELREQQQQAKIQEFGRTIVDEAMSPLGKVFESVGLKILPDDPPEEVEAKQEIAQAIYERTYQKVYNDPNNKAIVDETQAGIENLNELIAKKHMLKLQARIEKEGARQAQIFTGKRAQARNLQTEPLTKETPKVVPGVSGAAAFAHTADTTEPFNPDRATQVFQDIAARAS